MTRAERIAYGLVTKYGAGEAYWMANRRALGWLCDGTDYARVEFWRAVKHACAHRIGRAEAWT